MPLQLRRGTNAERTTTTPAEGEPLYTTDTKQLFIGDGTTAGGVQIGGGSGSGTVTSVGATVPTGLAVSGSPITTSGVLALTWNGQIPQSSLGTGTASSTTYLRGDGAWTTFPTIPSAQVNSDWNASSGVAQILNKPTIPAAQVNSDWNASSGVAQILNKPTIPSSSTTTPNAGGTGAVGTGTTYARNDHTHPFSLTTTGTSGASTYNSTTGVLNIPAYSGNSGTVTSVGATVPTGLAISGSPITTSGTLALTWNGQIPQSSLGTGTASSTTYLRGDGAWTTFPTIPAAQVNSDWNASSGVAQILNKPTIPSSSTTTPNAGGTGAVGTGTTYARNDHTHPFSLTTTGTSGASTYNSATGVLNIPDYAAGSGSGTVTSVGITAPAEFTVTGSPVTSSGTLALAKATQSPNYVWAGPASGSTAVAPTFRALVPADIPTLNQNTTGSAGSVANSLSVGTGLSGSSFNGSSAVTIDFIGTTINNQSSAYTLVASDAGKTIVITAGGLTVSPNVFPAGAVVNIINNSAIVQTIFVVNGLTMRWDGQSVAVGSRTMGIYSSAVITFISTTLAYIRGTSLT